MQERNRQIKVAAAQVTPIFFDNEATLQKIEEVCQQCADQKVDLVLFPESLIPGYPRGLDFGAVVGNRTSEGRELWQEYWDCSVEVDDVTYQQLRSIAAQYKLFLVVGVTERDKINRTLYCSIFFFDREGRILGKHRKIKPTGTERVIWGEGDGSSLVSYPISGFRTAGLICWENMMPLARMALYQAGVDLYLAPTADARSSWSVSMQHIASEGRCYLITSNQYFLRSDYPSHLVERIDHSLPEEICRGGSMIVSPYGQILEGPLYGEEGILMTEIDLDVVIQSKMDLDITGHYARQDLFNFRLRQ